MKRTTQAQELINLHKEYITLLVDEINNLIGRVHGYKSPLYEKGVELRQKILDCEELLKWDPDPFEPSKTIVKNRLSRSSAKRYGYDIKSPK